MAKADLIGFRNYSLNETLQEDVEAGIVPDKDITFVEDTGKIYTHGEEYGASWASAEETTPQAMIYDSFVEAPEYEDYDGHKESISTDSIVFVKETGREKLITRGKEFDFVPSNGKLGQVLTRNEEGRLIWSDVPDLIQSLIERINKLEEKLG